jgi:ribosomal protein S18 acetylase RimI-like enzyme
MSLQQAPRIRPAESSDIPALVGVHRESAEFHKELDARRYRIPNAQAIAEAFAQALAASDTVIVVAEVDGQIVGYGQVRLLPPPSASSILQPRLGAEIGLAVMTPWRRRGLRTALMQAAHAWAVQHGAECMQLNCHAANEAAIRLYEKLGYHTVGSFMAKRLCAPSTD